MTGYRVSAPAVVVAKCSHRWRSQGALSAGARSGRWAVLSRCVRHFTSCVCFSRRAPPGRKPQHQYCQATAGSDSLEQAWCIAHCVAQMPGCMRPERPWHRSQSCLAKHSCLAIALRPSGRRERGDRAGSAINHLGTDTLANDASSSVNLARSVSPLPQSCPSAFWHSAQPVFSLATATPAKTSQDTLVVKPLFSVVNRRSWG